MRVLDTVVAVSFRTGRGIRRPHPFELGYVRGMVVARDGVVIGEGHWSGTLQTLHQSRSVTKSVTSILIGIAIDKWFIKEGYSARLVDYLPAAMVPNDPATISARR